MRTREPRRKVVFRARMRLGRNWSDVVVRDLSSRGMLLTSDTPPPPGTYLEICGPATTMVVRSVWADKERFGVQTQDRIDIDALLSDGRMRKQDPPDLRAPVSPYTAPAVRYETSRRLASALELLAVMVMIIAASVTAAILLKNMFAAPIGMVTKALGS